MPRVKRPASPFDEFEEDFEDDTCSNSSKSGNPPIQRNAANARERARMRVLSSAFGRLKTKLPNIPPDTKLSKLDTLRLATIYIKQLKTLADSGTEKKFSKNTESSDQNINLDMLSFQNCASNMTWPFAFQHIHATSRQLTSQLPHNWNVSENLEESLRGNNTFASNQNMTEVANTFHNKYQPSDINNCLFDCLQQQQQISHYINRSHYNNQFTDCSDSQSQNTQIH